MKTIDVKFVDTSKVTWQAAKSLLYVTDEDILGADKYVNEEDKVAHLISAYFKRKYIGEWQIESNGKPVADGKSFNISHTVGAVIFAQDENDVGVDIEKIRPTDGELRRYIASDEEYDSIKDDKSFFELWTAKESIVKATGEGIAHPNKVPALPLSGKKIYKGMEFFSKNCTYSDYVVSVTLKCAFSFDIKITNEILDFSQN